MLVFITRNSLMMSFLFCFLMKRKEDMSIYWNKITTKFVGGKKRCLKLGFLTFSCKFVSFYLMDKLINGKRKYTLFIGRIYFVIMMVEGNCKDRQHGFKNPSQSQRLMNSVWEYGFPRNAMSSVFL